MGQKLVDFYSKAMEMGQIKAKMRLALITGISSSKASELTDTQENIEKFENALKKMEAEK